MHADIEALHSRGMDVMTGSVRSPLLIGRDALLELVDRRLAEVDLGHGQMLLVAGSAGIGKTRFLASAVHKARERGFSDIWSNLQPLDQDVPGGSLRDFARTAMVFPASADMGRDILAMLETPRRTNVSGRRQFALDIVDRILGEPDRPTVYVFEDVQWADAEPRRHRAPCAPDARAPHPAAVAGYRNDELHAGSSLRDWRSRLVTQRIAEELRLGPLSESETALVTTLILDTGLPAPRDVARAVYARTDGIPLYIEELLGAIGADARANSRAVRDAVVPDTIEDAVIRRLQHRSSEAQAAARAGAVIGRCFTTDVLADMMDVPAEALDGPLQELCDHFLLCRPTTMGTSISRTSCCGRRSTEVSRSGIAAATTPVPASSVRGSSDSPTSTPRPISNGPGCRRRRMSPRCPGLARRSRVAPSGGLRPLSSRDREHADRHPDP